jgi:hypothetical protein
MPNPVRQNPAQKRNPQFFKEHLTDYLTSLAYGLVRNQGASREWLRRQVLRITFNIIYNLLFFMLQMRHNPPATMQ